MGIFRSCAYGCNLDSTREARWPADKYVLGYWGGNWTVANGTVWDELRGLLTGWMDNNVRVCVYVGMALVLKGVDDGKM